MAPHFQLTRVRLLNYKSIADCDIRVGALNLLVGPNSAGKSNILDALQFLADLLNDGVESALRDRGGLELVQRRTAAHPPPVSLEIEAGLPEGSLATFRVSLSEATGAAPVRVEEYCRVTDASGEIQSEYSSEGGSIVASFPAVVPLPDILALAVHRSRVEFASLFAGLSGYVNYAIRPDAMRVPHPLNGSRTLDRDGGNIAGVLGRAERTDHAALSGIEDYLRVISSGVVGVHPLAVGDFGVIEFRQVIDGSDRPVGLSALAASDGTLRALGVLTALFAPSDSMTSPLGIEEPETGLHPAAAGVLLEALRLASADRQVFATTHSPDLLDSPSVKPDEVLAVRSVQGRTVVAGLDTVGREAVVAELFTVGELLRADQLFPAGYPIASQARL